ncbi:glycosyltransferase family 2 protein [Pararhodobacter sp. SW119]|uniref:glycosyltransferase family 2 protein n=1 Tax=Pararhodobacter sp. SW119 TaxID=2780075 RepID=UPI001ADF4645|nr:glycosyltransferase family 2 protein [Pararhodobacter sp. SW119]
MDLSIVIVNWNTREMTAACLESVLAGLGDLAAEVIVVDNASDDGSADMVADRFPRAILIRNDANRGFAAANNQGFAIARGRHVLLLNSDTLVHGAVLPASVAWLDTHAEVGAMGCRVLNTDGTVQLTCSRYPSIPNLLLLTSGLAKLSRPAFLGRYQMRDWARDSEREVEVISGCYLMVPRAVIEAVGGLDEAFFFFGEETDWCRRIRAAGWMLVFAPVGEITHHGGGTVKRLNHRRDVMLSEATVRLHRKHGGRAAAAAVFAILLFFNASRAVFWSVASALSRGARARERARHFRAVVGQTAQTWPRPAAGPGGTGSGGAGARA